MREFRDYVVDVVIDTLEAIREDEDFLALKDTEDREELLREHIADYEVIYYAEAQEMFENQYTYNVFEAIEYIQTEIGEDFKITDYCTLWNTLIYLHSWDVISEAIALLEDGEDLEKLYEL